VSTRGKTAAVLGGDRRMAEAVRYFVRAGLDVRVAGMAPEERIAEARTCSAADALSGAAVAVLPVQGLSADGRVFTQKGAPECRIDLDSLRRMQRSGTVFTGLGNPYVRGLCSEAGLALVEYREADEFAIWNSIPSAEGAIQMAMEATPFTLFGSRSLVLGFGRTGKALALLLRGLYSDVTVVARDELDRARTWACGYKHARWSRLVQTVAHSDVIFNTVPAPVLTREVLQAAPRHAVIVDVASAPGGTDFEAAGELGLAAKLAPGLPGIVAPITAGRIIAGMVLRHLAGEPGEEEDW